MKNFMDENFLLQTETAQKLYHCLLYTSLYSGKALPIE